MSKYPESTEELLGEDPYDALRSPFVPAWLRTHPLGRQIVIQVRKRMPLDLTRLLGIQPFVMAKTAACAIMATSRLARVDGVVADSTASELVRVMDAAGGNVGSGRWGYEFDVQTRWAYYPADSPNVIATCFAARALCEAGTAYDRQDWKSRARESSDFILHDLHERDAHATPFFRYVPDSVMLVHNANVLAAGLVAMVGALHSDFASVDQAVDCAKSTVAMQTEQGGWRYGTTPSLAWEDSFHTAYTLDGLLAVWLASSDSAVLRALETGIEAWATRFFGPDGEPFYTPGRGPYDIHCAATAIDVASRLASWGLCDSALANRVAAWTEEYLIDPVDDRPIYRRYRHLADRRKFVRWGDAHWWLARSSLALLRQGAKNPLEVAVARAVVAARATLTP